MKEEKERERFNREDSTAQKEESYKAFAKDKRKRISNSGSEKVEYRRREYTPRDDDRNGESEPGERRSYNPNFTADNRPAFEKKDYDGNRGRNYGDREYGRRDEQNYRPQYDKTGGNRKEYGGQRREYGDRPYNRPSDPGYGERREYGASRDYNNDRRDRDGNQQREYPPRERSGGSGYGEKREYTPRGSGYGDKREYAPRNNYGDRQGGYNRQGGDRQDGYQQKSNRNEGGQQREYTPRDRSAGSGYGDKREYAPRNNYGDRQGGYNRQGGDRQDGYQQKSNRNEGGQQREYTPRDRSAGSGYGDKREYAPRNNYGNRQGGYNNRGGDSRGGQQRRPDGKGGRKEYAPRYNSENYPTFPAPPIEDKMRLNRYVAMSGICSRREADDFIQSGVVTVNDVVVTEMGAKVSADDVVKFNGNIIKNEKKVYIVMNKPKGYVTSVEDPHADKTVMDLLKNGCRERVYPVGRLDKSSLGVLLITNDGDLAKKLTHPSYEKKKVYQVTLDKPLAKTDMDSIVSGITLEDGEIHADAVSYVAGKKNEIGIEIHSGRNRIVRRIFEHLGYRVNKLDRVYFAGLTKQRLRRGEWRFLTPREVQALQSGRYE